MNHDLGKNAGETLGRIAKYYIAQDKPDAEVRTLMEELILRCRPHALLSMWQETIESKIKYAKKHPMIEIAPIPITQKELDACVSAGGKLASRLAFTCLCLAKYGNAINENNNDWINRIYSEMFALANINANKDRQCALIRQVKDAGLVRYSRNVSNLNLQVTFIDYESEPVMYIDEFADLGYQFLLQIGEPYFHCSECGKIVKRNSNRQKYCKSCAKLIDSKKTVSARRAAKTATDVVENDNEIAKN